MPIERITAVCASKASMSRNWRVAVPGGPTLCHVLPPFVVRSTVPTLPLAHTTLSLTTESPRSRAVEPVGLSCHEKSAACPGEKAAETAAIATTSPINARRFATAREANASARTTPQFS